VTALRVLHVDDEPDIREVVQVSLGLDPDLVTRSCGSGHEALSVVADWPPDIILLDVMMPVMDGPTMLARLRDDARTANIPVIFMTARALTHELDRFRSLGAVGVLAKPFDPLALAASVRSYVQPGNVRPRLSPNDFPPEIEHVFLKRLSEDAVTLAKRRSALKHRKTLSATLSGIREIAHGLAGAGGIFGYSNISEAAAALEEAAVAEPYGLGSSEGLVRALDRLLTCAETICAGEGKPAR
jgi:CheY-like chemotaxis protein